MEEKITALMEKADELVVHYGNKLLALEGQLSSIAADKKGELLQQIENLKGEKAKLEGQIEIWKGYGGEAVAKIQQELNVWQGTAKNHLDSLVNMAKSWLK